MFAAWFGLSGWVWLICLVWFGFVWLACLVWWSMLGLVGLLWFGLTWFGWLAWSGLVCMVILFFKIVHTEDRFLMIFWFLG